MPNEITLKLSVDTTELDKAIEKANQLAEILQKPKNTVMSLSIGTVVISNQKQLSLDELTKEIVSRLKMELSRM